MDETATDSLPLHTRAPDATYGFIGLGNMGFGMAKNVRQRIPKSSKLVVCELAKAQRDKFCSTVEGIVETAESPKEVAEKCVCMYGACLDLFDWIAELRVDRNIVSVRSATDIVDVKRISSSPPSPTPKQSKSSSKIPPPAF